jgi:transcriptional regulator with XRE-family HTH domain
MHRDDVNRHIGRQLKLERRRRGLTQSNLAGVCGVTFQQIQKYEAGIVTISAGTLWKLADAMSISVGELFPDSPEPTRLAPDAATHVGR